MNATDKTRSCGSCTLCCRTMSVSEIAKPAHQWCGHCKVGSGCTIYADRPDQCRTFECVWLQDKAGVFADNLRPDRVGVVIQATNDGRGITAHCDPQRPTAWRRPDLMKIIKALVKAGHRVTARAGQRYWVIGPNGEWEAPAEHITRPPNQDQEALINVPHEVVAELGIGRQ